MDIQHWGLPTKIHCGSNAADLVGQLCQADQLNRPLVVTDHMLQDSQMCKRLLANLSTLSSSLFAEVHANPTCQDVLKGVQAFQEHRADCVIALGGGSALDAAKAIALMANQSLPVQHFIDEGTRWQDATLPLCPVIAIPTTAGTGSEVGRCAVVVDENTKRKLILFHPDLLPKHVILDPMLTVSLPARLTAFTGLDALSHNLEAFCVDSYHPICDAIAKEGIQLIAQNLMTAYQQPNHLEARQQMLVASSMGAIAFQKGLGAMHALSHSIGGLYGGHHGMLNAILMPYVLAFNQPAIEHKCLALCRVIGIKERFDYFIEWVLKLRENLEVPHTLKDLFEFDTKQVVSNALIDPTAPTNPIPLDRQNLEFIFSCALKGEIPKMAEEISKLKA